MSKQQWRYDTFRLASIVVERFCEKQYLKFEKLNNGYQIRVENLVDFYPVRGRYHILKSGDRGDWATEDDLRKIMLKALPDVKVVEVPTFQPGDTMEDQGGTINYKPGRTKVPGGEVIVPEHPFPFPELRPYQKAVFDELQKNGLPLPSMRFGRHPYTIGVDLGQPGGDKTVISHAKRGHNGKVKIWFDEVGEWPHYKWYRNPIKAYKWRRTMKKLVAHSKGKFLYTGTSPKEVNKLRRK